MFDVETVDNLMDSYVGFLLEASQMNPVAFSTWNERNSFPEGVIKAGLNALKHDTPDLGLLSNVPFPSFQLQALVALNPHTPIGMFNGLLITDDVAHLVMTYSGTSDFVLFRAIDFYSQIGQSHKMEPIVTRSRLSFPVIERIIHKINPGSLKVLLTNDKLPPATVMFACNEIIKSGSELIETGILTTVMGNRVLPATFLEKYSDHKSINIQSQIVEHPNATDSIIRNVLFSEHPTQNPIAFRVIVSATLNPNISLLTLLLIRNEIVKGKGPKYSTAAETVVNNVLKNYSDKDIRHAYVEYLLTVPGYDNIDYSNMPLEWVNSLTATVFKHSISSTKR